MRRRHAAPALLLLAALALGGCGHSAAGGADSADSKGEPAIGAVPQLLSTASLSYPLDAYIASDSQYTELKRAQNVLVSRCMKRYGFDFAPPAQTAAEPPAGWRTSRRYGLTDPQAAATRGYRSRVAVPPAKAEPELSANEELALVGPAVKDPGKAPTSWEEEQAAMKTKASAVKDAGLVNGLALPPGGCTREAFLRLFAPKEGMVDVSFADALGADAYTRAEQDSRVVRAVGAWSSCMAAGGYRSTHPVSPQEDLGLSEDALASPRAVAAAKTDVACKKKVDLVGVWYTVEVAYQKRAVEQNAERLAQARTELDDRMRVAAALAG